MKLPYENCTSGKMATGEIQSVLRKFGASSFGVMEDFAKGEAIVQFEWRGRRVTLRASAHGYAAAWLRAHPHKRTMRISEAEHRARALRQANISVWSILRDWVKGQVTAVEIGLLPFDAAFLAQITLASGSTVFEEIEQAGMLPLIEGPK